MKKVFLIKKKIKPFNKKIKVDGDKSLSIRWALLASLATGKSEAYNLPPSEDVLSSLECLKKLGINIKKNKKKCIIYGKGTKLLTKKSITLNARNSGTLGRLILGMNINLERKIKLIGDNSLSKRDFSRITEPLKRFGAKFISKNNSLPLTMIGTENPKPINYIENRGSAQCKSSVMLAALKTNGKTFIKAKKSRNHTELLFKYLKIPINIKKTKKYDYISVQGKKKIKNINYKIPGDISSGAFFLVLTLLSKNSKLLIKDINVNPSRIGIIKILKRMGAKILIKNKRIYKGEFMADIFIESAKKLKGINCPIKFNSSAIDEFLIIFLVAAKCKGVSHFKDLSELNQKESPRLVWANKILNLMGVKTRSNSHSIKIYGNPNLNINKVIEVKNYLKDHRIFMMSVIAALTFGGIWKIHDPSSVKTSFPSFLNIIRNLTSK